MRFYTCQQCRYTFASDPVPDRCPDCGKKRVREATDEEARQRVAAQLEEDAYLAAHPDQAS